MATHPSDLAVIFRAWLDGLAQHTPYRPEEADEEALVDLYLTLKGEPESGGGLIGALQGLANDVQAAIAECMWSNEQPIGRWIVTKRGGYGSWKFDAPASTRLVQRLAAQVADEAFDPDSGEVPPAGEIARRVAQRVADACNLNGGWRTGKLRDLGVEVELFAERVPGRETLQFVKAEDAA